MKDVRILIADDDETLCYLLKEELVNEGYNVDVVYDGKDAIELLQKRFYDVLLLDLEMKEVHGEKVLTYVKDNLPSLQVIVLTAKSDIRTAIDCIKHGAYDFITKPYEFGPLCVTIDRALEYKELLLRNKLLSSKVDQVIPNTIIGESEPIKNLLRLAEKAAKSESNILLEGETGTGKELFAQSMHNEYRPHGPFIAVNCAAMPRNLIESELFGYEPGSFTGAERSGRPGKIELAHGGTLFLDEIGDMPLELQAVLLRVLEDKQVMRIGGRRYKKVDFRLIAATNKELDFMIQEKLFREDLYFRLSVLSINLPPLRERGNDIELLSRYFIKSYCRKMECKQPEISKPAMERIREYKWPGNVRQLENAVIYAVNTAQNGIIEVNDLPAIVLGGNPLAYSTDTLIDSGPVQSIEAMERIVIENALYKTKNNITKAAEILGIGKSTLYRKLKDYDIVVDDK